MATTSETKKEASGPVISGGHLVAKALKNEGVDVIWTLCGGHIIDIYDGCLDAGIKKEARGPVISGGHLVAKALKNEGVDVIWTLCGGHIIDIYDGCLDEGIK